MAPCSWDAMQEQAPPDLLSLITPPEPPHLLDPARKVTGKDGGLGEKGPAQARRLRQGRLRSRHTGAKLMPSCPLQGELEGRHSPDREVLGGEAKVALG
eukprot:1007881-Pelagomonas_calceolata.AAC.1